MCCKPICKAGLLVTQDGRTDRGQTEVLSQEPSLGSPPSGSRAVQAAEPGLCPAACFRRPSEQTDGLTPTARERLIDRNIQKRDRKSQGRKTRRGWIQGGRCLLSQASSELFKHMTWLCSCCPGRRSSGSQGPGAAWQLGAGPPHARTRVGEAMSRHKHAGSGPPPAWGPPHTGRSLDRLLTSVPGGALRTVTP